MKSSSQCRCFKIGGNNVNGASCQGKMAQILTFARSFDIFCFQDTRLVSDPLQGDPSLPGSSNPALWKGQHFFLQGKASTTGLLIVVSPSSPAKLLVYHPPPSHPLLAGRYQRLDFVLEDEPYSLHNLYVPSDPQQRIAFLSLVHRLGLLCVPNRTNIGTGDVNCCLSPFDVTGGGLRDRGAAQMETILNDGLLIDAWRHDRSPTEIDYTHWHSQGPSSLGSGSRIDLFVISSSALARYPSIHSDILGPSPYTSDHLPISLSIPLSSASSILHHCLGGRPTKFYHDLTRETHPPTYIAAILPPDATAATPISRAAAWATDTVSVLRHFSDFYSADSGIGRFRAKATDGAASKRLLDSLPRRLPSATPLESERSAWV